MWTAFSKGCTPKIAKQSVKPWRRRLRDGISGGAGDDRMRWIASRGGVKFDANGKPVLMRGRFTRHQDAQAGRGSDAQLERAADPGERSDYPTYNKCELHIRFLKRYPFLNPLGNAGSKEPRSGELLGEGRVQEGSRCVAQASKG
jgi:hypothetical protein